MKKLTHGVEYTTDLLLAGLLFVIVLATFTVGLNLSPIGIETFDNDFQVLGEQTKNKQGFVFSPNILGTDNLNVNVLESSINETALSYSFFKLESGTTSYPIFTVSNYTEEEKTITVSPIVDSDLVEILSIVLIIDGEEFSLLTSDGLSNSVGIIVPIQAESAVMMEVYSSANINFPVDFSLKVTK